MRAAVGVLAGCVALGACSWAKAQGVSPLPQNEQCHAIEELEAEYPDSKFTKLTPSQVAGAARVSADQPMVKAIHDIYAVPIPGDDSTTVLHAYDDKGCWIGAAQISTDAFIAKIVGYPL